MQESAAELFHWRPANATPVILDLVEQVFGHASMREYEFCPAARSRSEGNCSHRVNTFGKIVSTPGLNQAASWNEVHIQSRDFSGVSRKGSADLGAQARLTSGDFGALA